MFPHQAKLSNGATTVVKSTYGNSAVEQSPVHEAVLLGIYSKWGIPRDAI
jgi:hypothetical protein